MRGKHLRQRINSCRDLAALSTCSRRQFGCVILEPKGNVVVSDSYNGPLRNARGNLCGDTHCLREGITSGSCLEIGCVHAEQNAIYNATRRGATLTDCWLFVNGEPCLVCAKAIIQVGISRVFCIGGVYSTSAGVDLLEMNNVRVHTLPIDASEEECDALVQMLQGIEQPRFSQVIQRSPFK